MTQLYDANSNTRQYTVDSGVFQYLLKKVKIAFSHERKEFGQLCLVGGLGYERFPFDVIASSGTDKKKKSISGSSSDNGFDGSESSDVVRTILNINYTRKHRVLKLPQHTSWKEELTVIKSDIKSYK